MFSFNNYITFNLRKRKKKKHCLIFKNFYRQYAARQILESLQFAVTAVEAYSEQDDLEKVFAYINKLSEDNGK